MSNEESLSPLEKALLKALKDSSEKQAEIFEKHLETSRETNNKLDLLINKITEHTTTVQERKSFASQTLTTQNILLGLVFLLVIVQTGRSFEASFMGQEVSVGEEQIKTSQDIKHKMNEEIQNNPLIIVP